MLSNMEAHVGETYNYLTLLAYIGPAWRGKSKLHIYKCRCGLCGGTCEALWHNICADVTKSCGCLRTKAYSKMRAKNLAENPAAAEQKQGEGLKHTARRMTYWSSGVRSAVNMVPTGER